MTATLENPEVEEFSSDEILQYQMAIRKDPVGFIGQSLGVQLWSKQAEIAEAFFNHNRVAVRSGNGVGKSFLIGSLTIAALHAYSPVYVITTGASWTGIEKILWPTIHKQLSSSVYDMTLDGALNQTEWHIDNMWGAFGLSPNTPERFGGFRTERGAIVIVDEASLLPLEIYNAIRGLCSTNDSKILLMGNPLRSNGPFFDAFRSPNWKTFEISTLDNPNCVAGKSIIPGLSDIKWVEEMKEEFGEDSDEYRTRVLAEFPGDSEHNIVPWEWKPEVLIDNPPTGGPKRMGVDVARFGSDTTVLLIRDDKTILHMERFSGISTTATTGHTRRLMKEFHIAAENVYIDDVGVGGGVVDNLHEAKFNVNAIGFGEGSVEPGLKKKDKKRYANKRAECYWLTRLALDPRLKHQFKIPMKFKAAFHELVMPGKKIDKHGRILVEDKESVKKRLKRSPDVADALVMTFSPFKQGKKAGSW